MTYKDYFKYAWFADLAYVEWDIFNSIGTAARIKAAVDKRLVPQSLAEKIFIIDGWSIPSASDAGFYANDPITGFAANLFVNSATRERIAIQQELAAQQEQRKVLNASLESLSERRKVTDAQYQSRWMAELTETETKLSSYVEEIAKAERRLALTTLTAPVSGTVQQLAVHTEGGVVTEAQPLMVIVPDDSPIEVEAMVPNKDIGFVHEGQAAIVKIETFNFTKYGYIEGRVSKVSRDAMMDKDKGLYYLPTLRLRRRLSASTGKMSRLSRGWR